MAFGRNPWKSSAYVRLRAVKLNTIAFTYLPVLVHAFYTRGKTVC